MDVLMGGLTGTDHEKTMAHRLARLPMRLGGLGLRRASRMALAAFWSQMIHQRLPEVAHTFVESLDGPREVGGCLGELRAVTTALDQQGFTGRPSWVELKGGCRPPPANLTEPGEWAHGWQFYASSVSEHYFRKTAVLTQSCPSHQAHLRSHSGGGSSNVLHGCPTKPEFAVEPDLFRNLILERLRLPLAVTDATCECGAPLDSRGRHRAACSQLGQLRTRAVAPERHEHRSEGRRWCIEVVASGLPLFHGAQLAVDITLRVAVSPGRVQPVKMESLVQTKLRSTRSCSLGIVVGSLWLRSRRAGGGAQKHWSSWSLARSRARGSTHTGTICIPRLEEEVVSHAVYLVCASVRHLFDGGAKGVARGGQRRWRDS